MTIHQAESTSIADLESQVYALVECDKFGDALDAIRQFVESVIFNQRSVGKVFASADLDKLCRYIGEVAANKTEINSPNLIERKGTVILATELVKAGGHVELIKDIIRLKLFDAPISILLTDLFDRVDDGLIVDFSVTYGVTVEVAKGRTSSGRLEWLLKHLCNLAPTTLVLLTHNQDSVGIAAANAHVADKVVFIHHADHHLTLGVTCEDFIHVDPHNIGFFHCKDELGIKNNYYWPLTVNCDDLEPRSNSFLVEGNLVTCSSGRTEKFDASNYLYDYFKLIPKLLAATSGRHIHIGSLTADIEAKLQQGLMTEGVDSECFINIPWVSSVARTLIENNVDLYISSFPLGGGKASLEAMAVGIPLLMHQSYRSRFHGGVDLAYPDAWTWRTEAELFDIVRNMTVDDLTRHSLLARTHYDKFHSDQSVIDASDFSRTQDLTLVPKLREYSSDELQLFLDENIKMSGKNCKQIIELNKQLEAYKLQAEQFNELLQAAGIESQRHSQIIAERDGQINAYKFQAEQFNELLQAAGIESERLGQIIAERDGQINAYKLQSDQFYDKLLALSAQITDLNQAVTERDDQIDAYKLQAEQFNELLQTAGIESERLGQIIAERDTAVYNLRQLVLDREQVIVVLYGSNSWRITQPLRSVSRFFSRKSNELYFVKSSEINQVTTICDSVGQEVAAYIDNLPNDFDGDIYLKLNPDLVAAGVDAIAHFLQHGQHEGRIYSLPDFSELHIELHIEQDVETILVVSHEASRTGAPILSLNLVQSFVESYNVVVLLLGGGALTEDFRRTGATVITQPNLRQNPVLADLVVNQLCQRVNFKFALVNSIESRAVLTGLANCFVPTISLIHEFASYTRPRHAIRDALYWSGEVVFSAKLTLENAYAEYPDLNDQSAHILPQGRCLVPLNEYSEEQQLKESARIRQLIRPKNIADNSVIVLGAGAIQLRKGVDLFIECAARVFQSHGGDRCRFVWIGKGYDPENDLGYSVYLADQIQRSGLDGHVLFIDETTAIEIAYEEADLLLLSSRLDPLPNVAIDAMAYGVPVLCFNNTTGIADCLIDSGLQKHCVAEYLDSVDMAEKILALTVSDALRKEVSEQCRAASIACFNMKEYVARLEVLTRGVCDRTQQEKVDVQTILDSGLFRTDFSCSPHSQGQSMELAVRSYVRSWASGIGRRKPFPGFHPGVYQELHGVEKHNIDPFADYLRAGCPDGPWNNKIITVGKINKKSLPTNQRVALHLHVYYPELLNEIVVRLAHNQICPDLFISINNESARKLVVNELENYQGKVVDIQVVPNRGRDIGSFLTAFGSRLMTNYDFVGHIHTKISADVKNASMGQSWYRFLLENLLGGASGSMADSILSKMKDDASIGMVFPDDPHVVGIGVNRVFAEELAGQIGLEHLPEHFIFPVGTMFWARPSALRPLMSLNLDWDDYPEEPLAYDGSVLHAIERLFSLTLPIVNMRSATTNLIGVTR